MARASRRPATTGDAATRFVAGRTIVFAGGLPLLRGGVLVGGVGVSGGSSAEDQRAVEAGVRAFSGA